MDDLTQQTRAAEGVERSNWLAAVNYNITRLQLALSGAGMIGLFYTLLLTRRATRAAQESNRVARELGEAEIRAYISDGGVKASSHYYDADPSRIYWRFTFCIRNTGATPARRVHVRAFAKPVAVGEAVASIPDEVGPVQIRIGRDETLGVYVHYIEGFDLAAIKRSERVLFFLCEVHYGNAINPRSNHITRICVYSSEITGDPTKLFDERTNPVDVTFSHVPGFNCSDEECG